MTDNTIEAELVIDTEELLLAEVAAAVEAESVD
jgi:hypothetical protein